MQEQQELRAIDQISYLECELKQPARLSREWLGGLPAKLQDALLDGAAILNARRGRVLSAQGTLPDVCFGVLSGLVKLYHTENDGRQITLGLLTKGQWFGEFGVLQGSSQFTAEAMVDSSIAVIRKSAVRSFVQDEAVFGEALAQLGWQTTKSLLDRLLSQGSVEGRILWFIDKTEHMGAIGGKTLTQAEIAEVSGASRQRVNEALNRLLQKGRLQRSCDALSGYARPSDGSPPSVRGEQRNLKLS